MSTTEYSGLTFHHYAGSYLS